MSTWDTPSLELWLIILLVSLLLDLTFVDSLETLLMNYVLDGTNLVLSIHSQETITVGILLHKNLGNLMVHMFKQLVTKMYLEELCTLNFT